MEDPGITMWLLLISVVIFILLLFGMALVTVVGGVVGMASLKGPIGCWAKVMAVLAIIITILVVLVML
jgi:hypothetical protein